MKVAMAIAAARERLAAANVAEAGIIAEYLLAELCGCHRLRLADIASSDMSADDCELFESLLARLEQHEPLQYLLGYTEFYGRRFNTDPRALIPRPETEGLIERVLATQTIWEMDNPRVFDVGTGSGCIAITLALEHPNAAITAIDISVDALCLARENARMHGVDAIEWCRGDLLEGIAPESADLIVSNPPYVASTQMQHLDRNIIEYEPLTALDGGSTGLREIERLVAEAADVLNREGCIFLEIGEDQGLAVRHILQKYGFKQIEIEQDLAGHDRIAIGIAP